jgi:thiol-disulfide isomerase/thioredoxin
MKKLMPMILATSVLLVVLYFTEKRRYDGFVDGGDGKQLLIVKASWCGHCKTAMPDFERLVKASPVKLGDGSSVKIRMLDEKKDKDEVAGLNVKGFPTILYVDGGNRMEYSGERTYTGVMGFLQNM